MKKHTLMRTNIFICLIIILGFFINMSLIYKSMKEMAEENIESVSKLSSSNLYAEIDNSLTKPIYVSQTMASDTFLKQWLREEPAAGKDDSHLRKIKDYLMAMKEQYSYNTAFVISADSASYYYHDGVYKTVSAANDYDSWYYEFLESGLSMDLDVDTDEAINDDLTVFVNCRVEDMDGSLLGVTGVGVRMSRLQALIKNYGLEYGLNAFVIDSGGKVQIHTDTSQIITKNLFDDPQVAYLKDTIISNKKEMEIHWYPQARTDSCLLTRYIPNMDWYLVVEKDLSPAEQTFRVMLLKEAGIAVLILALLLCTSTFVMHSHHDRLIRMSQIDMLTGLPNHDAFERQFCHDGPGGPFEKYTFFLFDIDDFKTINDTKGHLYGNQILSRIGKLATDVLGDHGMIVRWGGDEFAGMLYLPMEESKKALQNLMEQVAASSCDDMTLTISVGVTTADIASDLSKLLEEADQAMYYSKHAGKAKLTDYKEIEHTCREFSGYRHGDKNYGDNEYDNC